MNDLKFIKLVGTIGVLCMLFTVSNVSAQYEPVSPVASSGGGGGSIINTVCPVTPGEDVDPAFTVEYEGQTIGLCCRKCRTRFDANPESYLAELPMLQVVSLTSQAELSHDDSHDHASNAQETSSHEHASGDQHDHATDHAKGDSRVSKLIAWIGKFHPPATHLPIGMLIGAVLAEGLFMMTKRDLFRNAGAFCVVIAGLGALAAVTLGWFNGGFVFVDDQWEQTVHRWLGTTTTVLTLLSVVMLIRASTSGAKPSARLLYRVLLFLAAGMVGATGFFGGALVYGLNHYQW